MTFLWNYALAQRRDAWTLERRNVTYLDQQAHLKEWRAFDIYGLGAAPYDVARDCLQRLDLGYRAAFRRLKGGKRPGLPRFRHATSSFTCIPDSDPWVKGPGGSWSLKVTKVGAVPARRHRPPPAGSVRSIVVSREGNDWYATLQYLISNPAPPPETEPAAPVGIDLGLTHVAALSTGETVQAPRFLLGSERRLRRLQQSLSRKRRGSNRWKRQRERVAKCHATIRRQRRHWAHQLTSHWAARHDLIAFEDLDVTSFVNGNRLAKGIADAGWGVLRQMASYKEQMRSGRYVEVPTRGTTQTCSRCGKVADPPLTLKDRVFRCPCGHEEDRDVNAARNVLARGLVQVRRNTTEERRVDGTPPPTRKGRRAYQRKRELTSGKSEAGETPLCKGAQVPQRL
jgi:putative transposase